MYGDGPQQGPRYAIVFGYTHLFTPNLTNEFHAGYLHTVERLDGAFGDKPGIPAQFGIGGVPQIPEAQSGSFGVEMRVSLPWVDADPPTWHLPV